MQPVISMFIGTCADIRPTRIIFVPVSGWNAESYTYFAFHTSSMLRASGIGRFSLNRWFKELFSKINSIGGSYTHE